MIYNALVATLNPGDEVDHPAPYWVSYPDIDAAGRRHAAVFVATTAETGFKLHAGRPGSGDHAEDQVGVPELARPTRRARPTRPPNCRRIADVLLRHPQVWILTDDMYEHLVFDDFQFWHHRPGRAGSSMTAR